MEKNILNIWFKNVATFSDNKKVIFLKVDQYDNYQNIVNELKEIRSYISIIKLEDLKENKYALKGMNNIIISNSSETIENMKFAINREIIYIEDMNSIYKLISLLKNKNLDDNNEIKYELLQKLDFEYLLKEEPKTISSFVSDRLSLLRKINSNFENMDREFLMICLKNYDYNKLLFASFAQLLYRLATLDFDSSTKRIGAKIYELFGVKSKVVNPKQLDQSIKYIYKNIRVYDLKEKPFVTDTKIKIAQKLLKSNIKELDITKISKIIDLPLKKVEKMYREVFLN